MNGEDVYLRIPKDLARLARARPPVFGSNMHAFRLHAPVPQPALSAFETEHRVRLPSDYREFLLRVGRGGAGPYYGLFDLGQMDDGHGHKDWREGDGFVGVLGTAFPFTEAWNDLRGMPDDDLPHGDEGEFDRPVEEFETKYWMPLDGAIPICHLGCALRQWLVVTGPEAGHVWGDDRADYKGLSPLAGTGTTRVSFLGWYMDWLDQALLAAE